MFVLCQSAPDEGLFCLQEFTRAKVFFGNMGGKLAGFVEGRNIFWCGAAADAGGYRKQEGFLLGTAGIPVVCQEHGLRGDADSIAVDQRQYQRGDDPKFFLHEAKVISILVLGGKKLKNGSLAWLSSFVGVFNGKVMPEVLLKNNGLVEECCW